jgi:hypothetical protein
MIFDIFTPGERLFLTIAWLICAGIALTIGFS